MIGKVVLDAGNELVMGDDYRWSSETVPSLAGVADELFGMSDYSPADGAPGVRAIARAAEFFRGTSVVVRGPIAPESPRPGIVP